MSAIHIHAPSGYYLGQVKGRGCRKWRTVTKKIRNSWRLAMSAAVRKMKEQDHRARVIFCTDDGWYEPTLIMEAKR